MLLDDNILLTKILVYFITFTYHDLMLHSNTEC